jgi:hypothetical protein
MNSMKLKLRPGDVVEVRSEAEILATLDANGRLDNLPFMPEMLAHCGRQYRVEKRADKTCDTINYEGNRRMYDTVHLAGMRCDGSAHGDCQAACPFYWKEAWLKRVSASGGAIAPAATPASYVTPGIDHTRLVQLTRRPPAPDDAEVRYQCQATEILTATHPMKWWDVRQYLRDVTSGNVGVSDVFAAIAFRLFRKTISARWFRGYTAVVRAYNGFQKWRGGPLFPETFGQLEKTPKQTLDLVPGERVRVKPLEEIRKTVNTRSRNRGLSFDAEMVRYCGRELVVRSRVEQIIDERTGRMVKMSSDCIILEGAVCEARCSHKRLFCPRLLYPFWREIWLERVDAVSPSVNPARVLAVKSSSE